MKSKIFGFIVLLNCFFSVFLLFKIYFSSIEISRLDKELGRLETVVEGYEKSSCENHINLSDFRLLKMRIESLESKVKNNSVKEIHSLTADGKDDAGNPLSGQSGNVNYLEKANDVCDKIENGEKLSPVELMAYDVIRGRLTNEELILFKGRCYE